MAITISKLITHLMLWRLVGFISSIVGFTCYALSPSFHDLFGKRNPFKMVIYTVFSSTISIFMLLVKTCRWEILKSFLLKAHVGFLVITLTSMYSYWEDRSEEGKDEKGFGRVMNLTSTASFALMAMSLSRQLQLGFEVGIFNFFIGCFLVTVMKMNLKLAPLAAFFCYLLVNIRSFSEFILEMRGHGPKEEHADEFIDTGQDTNNRDGKYAWVYCFPYFLGERKEWDDLEEGFVSKEEGDDLEEGFVSKEEFHMSKEQPKEAVQTHLCISLVKSTKPTWTNLTEGATIATEATLTNLTEGATIVTEPAWDNLIEGETIVTEPACDNLIEKPNLESRHDRDTLIVTPSHVSTHDRDILFVVHDHISGHDRDTITVGTTTHQE